MLVIRPGTVLRRAGGVVADRRADAADGVAVRIGLVQQAAAGIEGGGEGITAGRVKAWCAGWRSRNSMHCHRNCEIEIAHTTDIVLIFQWQHVPTAGPLGLFPLADPDPEWRRAVCLSAPAHTRERGQNRPPLGARVAAFHHQKCQPAK